MPNVNLLTIDELVERAISEAPKVSIVPTQELPKTSAMTIADKLDKLASQIENEKQVAVADYKADQSEKRAALTQIVKTYLELESSK